MAVALRRLRPYAPAALIALGAVAIAWGFAATTLVHTRPMGLPLDDSYIYLTYAKQFGRGQPFTYFSGGGYSAGATSALWPMVLAPFWALGARGQALVWVSFLLCTALYAAAAVGTYAIVRRIAGELAGVVTAAVLLGIAPLAWSALSGMEVALELALLVALVWLLVGAPREGPPSRRLGLCLAALGLARPEAMLVAIAVCATYAVQRARGRALRAAAWWLAPLAAPAAWLVANRVFAGHFAPNTAIAKSVFYQPGFDWTFWRTATEHVAWAALRLVYWDARGPLVWPRVVTALYVIGAVRVALWARRERRYLVGALVIAAPVAWLLVVIATAGSNWWAQSYRYIAPVLALSALPAGAALAPPRRLVGRARHAWGAVVIAGIAGFAVAVQPAMADEMLLYAQGAMDTNAQVVRIGAYLHRKLPHARVMLHDAGAIAYFGDTPVFDMLGLVTNGQAEVAANGPGARFEMLEHLPPDRRPTHFAYYPGWMGTTEFFGDVLLHTPLAPGLPTGRLRLAGGADMQLIVANWDHVGTAERPLEDHTGWSIVDRVDVADLESEAAHGWVGALGRRNVVENSARWSVVEREVGPAGLLIDGGRTILGGGERFTVTLDPALPTRVILRTGGQRAYPFNPRIDHPVTLTLFAGTRALGQLTLPPPSDVFTELTFTFPAHSLPARVLLRTSATGPYRSFHWFILQSGVGLK